MTVEGGDGRTISRRGFVRGALGGGAAMAAGVISGPGLGATAAMADVYRAPNAYATDVVYNFCNATSARLLLAANHAAHARVALSYIGGKVGNPAWGFHNIPAVDVPAGSTRLVDIDLSHPAFQGGYGAVQAMSVDITGAPSPIPFQAFSILNGHPAFHLVSGPALAGTEFWLPLTALPQAEAQRVLLVVNYLGSAGALPVRVRSMNQKTDEQFFVPPATTVLWDSVAGGVDVNVPDQLLVESMAPVVISAFFDRRRPTNDVHMHLVAL